MSESLFPLGQIVITPAAQKAFENAGEDPMTYLQRHARGDWGELDSADRALNQRGLAEKDRLFSRYFFKDRRRFWIVTEHDRSATTILLPEDY